MNIAFIPVRGGSKSIPHKNIQLFNNKPLVYWTIKAACACTFLEYIYVATDCNKIKEAVLSFGFNKVNVVGRSDSTATDTAPTESAMLEFAHDFDFDNIILIQATSPLLTTEDLIGGFEMYLTEGTDSVLSAVRQKRFIWEETCDGFAKPQNYNIIHRPRRQEFSGYLVENGAFYITSKVKLIDSKNRISGNIKIYEMASASYFEIDEPIDWLIAEQIMIKDFRAATYGDIRK